MTQGRKKGSPKRWADFNEEQKRLHTEAMRKLNPNYLNPDEKKNKKRPTAKELRRADPANLARPGVKICGAKRSDGQICCQIAGWGTLHKGEGACKNHGGGTQNHLIKAVREEAVVKNIMYGGPIDIDPDTAVLQELCRTAGHVAFLHAQIQADVDEPGKLFTVTAVGVSKNPWLGLYQQEREHLVKVAKAAKDMGIAERQVTLAENQGRMIAMVISNVMSDPILNLSPQQRIDAKSIIRKHLMAIDVASNEVGARALG